MFSMNADDREIFSVSQLNALARHTLEEVFRQVWIEGEISNLATPYSGHIYLTLKDANAQVRCAMFKGRNRHLTFTPEDGQQVIVRGNVSIYEPRGDYQVIIEHMELSGDGALQRAFEALKKKLEQEGLFDSAHKKELPELPQQIGVITSATGAAIRDILSVLKRRFPAIPVVIYPCQVQGRAAASEIVEAIGLANQRQECDVLIVARGGGSLEDLWPFNEEIVARAIYKSLIPIVSGVGHEIDFTIADFVADKRAPTPSAAAELISPDQQEWLDEIVGYLQTLIFHINHRLKNLSQELQWLTKRLRHPGDRLFQHMQHLDLLEQRLQQACLKTIHRGHQSLHEQILKLQDANPMQLIKDYNYKIQSVRQKLEYCMKSQLQHKQQALQSLARSLNEISPLATLERGYAIMQNRDKKIVRGIEDVEIGDKITARLHQGHLECTVDNKFNDSLEK